MTITHTNKTSNVNSAATGAQATASVTLTANAWVLVAVTTQGNSATHLVTGSGLTFNVVREGVFDTNKSISWHKCQVPGGGFTGALTITPSAAIGSIAWAVIELATDVGFGTDPIVQNPVIATGTGTNFTKALNAPRDAQSETFAIASHNVFQGLAADAGMTEICDHPGNSSAQSFQVAWSNGTFDQNPSTTAATSGNWGYLAIEVGETAPASGLTAQVWDGATWITADAVWHWDGAAWEAGTLHAFDGSVFQ